MKGISRVLFLAVLAHVGHPSLSTSGAPLENPFPLGTIGERACVVCAILGGLAQLNIGPHVSPFPVCVSRRLGVCWCVTPLQASIGEGLVRWMAVCINKSRNRW